MTALLWDLARTSRSFPCPSCKTVDVYFGYQLLGASLLLLDSRIVLQTAILLYAYLELAAHRVGDAVDLS